VISIDTPEVGSQEPLYAICLIFTLRNVLVARRDEKCPVRLCETKHGVSQPLSSIRRHPDSFQRDGIGRLSVLSKLLDHNDIHGSKEREKMIKDVTAVAYAGIYPKPTSYINADLRCIIAAADTVRINIHWQNIQMTDRFFRQLRHWLFSSWRWH
jgi:hypothetical protein